MANTRDMAVEAFRALAEAIPPGDAAIAEIMKHMADELFIAWAEGQGSDAIDRILAEYKAILGNSGA